MIPPWFLSLGAGLVLVSLAGAADFYVAPNGDDHWSGTLAAPAGGDGPFATLNRARDRVRELIQTKREPVTVQVRAGLYALPAAFDLGPEDSGTPEAPVVYRAYPGEHPVLTGGLAVSNFEPYQGAILKADLSASGLKGKPLRQLIFAGRRQPLARYPNFDASNPVGGGWAYADGEQWPMYADKEGENKKTLQVKPQDWRTWAKPQEVEVFIFPRFNWWNDILRVQSADADTHKIATVGEASYGMRANDRYYFQNALEELDAPGEWYFDSAAGVLYFWPPAPLGGQSVLVPKLASIVTMNGTGDVTLQGFDFQACTGDAVSMKGTVRCRVAASTLHDVGGFNGGGITINGGHDNGVVGCDIGGTGRNGISLSGGDRDTLTASNNYAENCYIHHVGVFYKQGVGVALSGVGQRVSHCLIHDTPRFAIMFSGQKHLLEYNHLRHLALETEDVGATYCGGRDWLGSRGTTIRYNYIHDVLGYGYNGKWTSPYFAWGIYLDDNTGGVDVIGNIVARCGRSLIHGHSARDCVVENNVFVEGAQRQWEFNGWLTSHHFWTGHLEEMTKGYESVAHLPAWQGMRGMNLSPEQVVDAQGRVMSGNEFHRNIMAWHSPEARALNAANFDPQRNHFDDNLYWAYGNPLQTNQHQPGPPIGGNLVEPFQGQAGQLPAGWSWQIRGRLEAKAALVQESDGLALRVEAGFDPEKKRDNYPIVSGREIELAPGTTYQLGVRAKGEGTTGKAALLLQSWIPAHDGRPAHFWGSSPSEMPLTPEWKDYRFTFTLPAPGGNGWHPEMKKFRVRLDWNQKEGAVLVRDIVLQQVQTLDEWASWQALGSDRHSLVADPKFVASEKDDYRLQPDSPAFKLGFKPIPVEKIGPYADALRASWPIVEAEGVRERPIR